VARKSTIIGTSALMPVSTNAVNPVENRPSVCTQVAKLVGLSSRLFAAGMAAASLGDSVRNYHAPTVT